MERDTDIGGPGGRFPATRHSAILATRSEDAGERTRGYEALVASYWKPAYKYVRIQWKAGNEEAKDLTQGFFMRAMEKGWFQRYDPSKAAFRTYLRTCLDGYVSNERKAAKRLKRSGDAPPLSLDFETAEGELRHIDLPAADGDPDAFFHQEWVRSLFAFAVDTLRDRCDKQGKTVHFALFSRYDLDDTAAGARPTYAELAREFDLPTTQVTNFLAWVRREFRRIVLDRLREVTGSDEEFRAEARALLGHDPNMKWLSDSTLAHLRRVADWPELGDGKYRIVEELARGGMGTVYVAEDTELVRQVALKVLNDPLSDPEAAERLVREAQIIARLEHPGIVPVHDVGRVADGRIYYVMKLVRGDRLDRHFANDASIAERLRVFERICEAVSFAHAHGVIHRDLKPANVMVGPFGEVLVMDWGVAKLAREDGGDRPARATAEVVLDPAERPTLTRHTAHGTIIGTPAYMAPEQARGDVDAVDERSDVYALGAILYYLLTRRDPPEAVTAAGGMRRESLEPPRKLDPSIPRALEAICVKALAETPAERYARAEDLRAEIARFQAGQAVAAYPEGPFEKLARFANNYRTPILLVLAYLVMRLALLAFGGR